MTPGDRFRRFRHLERPRQPGGPGPRDQSPETEGRFGALEERKDAGTGTPQVAGGHLDRFRPAPERPLEVAPAAAAGELPFVRCASCQMDHNRAAAFCANCGADLRTEEARAFNARLAEERRAQGAVEAAQVAELERAQRDAVDEAAKAKRAMAETLAREVGDAERRRLDVEGIGGPPRWGGWGAGGGGWGSHGSGTGWSGPGAGGRWGSFGRGALGVAGWVLTLLFRFLLSGRRRRW